MNEKDLSSLSYKELQALAVKYRVPGNIKKHLLIRVLQSVRSGNGTEVDRILSELHQARKKKRLKKLKREKMNVMSTPMHSPSYGMSEDCYYPQQQPPYQWVGAQEEIASRDEGSMRVPDYEEFERFLLRRIQRDYESYAISENVQTQQASSIVDLRMGAGSSTIEPLLPDPNRVKSNAVLDVDVYARACGDEAQQHTLEDPNDNNNGPVLLKKMLEAPAGANLGAIASPEMGLYRMWSSEKYANNVDNPLDDSDTLTADSDNENDDIWETARNINNNVASGYYRIVNGNKPTTVHPNDSNPLNRAFHESQLTNNIVTDGTNHYQVVYPVSDVQANCQKWIATNTFADRDPSYSETMTDNTRGFHPIYYEETSGNSTATGPINLERKNNYNGSNQNIIYEANQTLLQGQLSDDGQQFYQTNNPVTTAPVNPMDVYYSQQMSKRVGDNGQEYFPHGNYGNTETTLQNVYQPTAAVNHADPLVSVNFNGNGYNKETGSYGQPNESNGMEFDGGYYQPYHHGNNHQPVGSFSYVENTNQPAINQNQHHNYNHGHQQQPANVAEPPEMGTFKTNGGTPSVQPSSNGALDSFWPRWPINGAMTSEGQLETILNIHNCNNVDFAKMDQTSCVYCYTAPVVTQRTDVSNSLCTQKKRLVAECRQHVFSPNRLVYNDASTGMRMSNMSELSQMKIPEPQQSMSTSTDPETGTRMESTSSSDSSINDVWIHDYSRYPVSSDNDPQSVGLIIDENEDDLFSL